MNAPRVEARSARQQIIDWLTAATSLQQGYRPAGWRFCSIEDLVLTHGRWGTPAPLSPAVVRGPEGLCFANANANATAASELHDGFTYVEGYALGPAGIVLAHAWCIDDAGLVQDPTWPPSVGFAYLGIPFTTDHIREWTARARIARIVHDAHFDGFRILREGLPAEAIASIGEAAHATPRPQKDNRSRLAQWPFV